MLGAGDALVVRVARANSAPTGVVPLAGTRKAQHEARESEEVLAYGYRFAAKT